MVRSALIACPVALLLTVSAAWAQQPMNLLPSNPPAQEREEEASPQVPTADKPLLEEPSPNFQAVRPVEERNEPEPQTQVVPPAGQASPAQGAPAAALPQTQPLSQPLPPVEPATPAPFADLPPFMHHAGGLPLWALGGLIVAGAFLACFFGIVTAMLMRRGEIRGRRRAVAATLATELETRRQAFDAVPLPPNVDAGVSFVSSVTSLAGIDTGFRAMQGQVHLLPEKVAAHVSVHYAAVQRVSDFVKGQSLAAAVRMLQANRLGGNPCPDAGAMRDAHEELGVAFRGVEKLVQTLRVLR